MSVCCSYSSRPSRGSSHKALRSTRSTPPPVQEDRVGLDQISEENSDDMTNSPARHSRQRSVPVILEPPNTSGGRRSTSITPSSSPQTRKRRMAQSRRSKGKSSDELGGAGEGRANEGEGLVSVLCPTIQIVLSNLPAYHRISVIYS